MAAAPPRGDSGGAGTTTPSEPSQRWQALVTSGESYHYGVHVAVLGCTDVGKSEIITALSSAQHTRSFRFGYKVQDGMDAVYLKGQLLEVEEKGIISVETSTAAVCVMVYCDEESLHYALTCCSLTRAPLLYLVYNDFGGGGPAPALPSTLPPGVKYHVVNAAIQTGVSSLLRTIADDVWTMLPFPPEASLLPPCVTMGPLFTECPAFVRDLTQRLFYTEPSNAFAS